MEQDQIYRILLELKENSGKTNAKLDDIKESLVEQSIKHDKLAEKHNSLQSSHDSYKGRVIFTSTAIGTLIGGAISYLYHKIFS